MVFVEGALPGELVTARIVAESKDYSRATVTEVVEPNERRMLPPCPYVARGCGGCDLQHARADLQLEMKQAIVEESLRRLGGVPEPEVRTRKAVDASAQLRTTVRVAGAGGYIGFRRKRSHEIVAVESCLVAHGRINDIISELVLEPGAEAVVRVSESSGESLVWVEPADALVTTPVGVQVGATSALREVVAGVTFRVSAGSFFQSSPGAARMLVDAVANALGDPATWPVGPVIDAYGGVGLFAATVVPADRHVILIESNPFSCADARENLAPRSADIVEERVERWIPVPAAAVIADPSRDGLKADAADVLTTCAPAVFVLVSCDPASLGRDARLLIARGYRFEYCEVLDAFPHTHHVEAVSRFVRSEIAEVP